MKIPYTYSVLHYVYDAAGREFVNVGVVVYAPNVSFLEARCTSHYRRAAQLFGGIDGAAFRRVTGFVEREVNRLGEQLSTSLPLSDGKIEKVLARILPPDDSAMQFAEPGAGLSADLRKTLDELYERFVGRYERTEREKRTEDDVWRTFREPLAQRQVVHHLAPKKIIARNYEYEFEHAWKNARWHALEPISFDLTDQRYVLEKASHWVGRVSSLQDSHDQVQLHVLLGAPQDDTLNDAFVKAQNLLHKMPGHHEFHREEEAEQVAEWFAAEVREHEGADD